MCPTVADLVALPLHSCVLVVYERVLHLGGAVSSGCPKICIYLLYNSAKST